ncbi:MAG: F0F1 ATP synthase subunit epsilon [Bacillaceae bacterium]|nr:F0F1 ATP synthase subunit epsilon [Bacillaceae bacterium]
MSSMQVEVVTPERVVYRGEASMVIARGSEGDLGIMPNHMPLVTPLKIAPVRVKKDDREDVIAVSGGFMEVEKEKVTILAEAAELPEEIDVDRAMAAKERAERRLAESGKEEYDFKRAELALERALVRIQVAKGNK